MTYYQARNPYRASTGTMPLPPSPPSIPLNTPWSPTNSSVGSLVSNRSRRRSSISDNRPAPLIVQRPTSHALSPPVAQRSPAYYGNNHATIVPASSIPAHQRHYGSGTSLGAGTTVTSRTTRSSSSYYKAIETVDDQETGHDFPRRGRTKFPHKLVEIEAIEESGYAWQEDEDGRITVLRALGRPEIERLVELSEEIRRRRSTTKAVSFYEQAIVHDIPPLAPTPPVPETIIHHHIHTADRPMTPLTLDNMAVHNYHSSSLSSSHSGPTYVPLKPPSAPAIHSGSVYTKVTLSTPSMSLPKDKITRAEQRAVRAEEKAVKKEIKADMTGRIVDELDARAARAKADEKMRKLEQTEWKESVKREEREVRRSEKREGLRTEVNSRGDVIIRI